MILSQTCFFSSSLSSSASSSSLVEVSELDKPRKVGRPKKKKDVEIAFVEVDEPILPQGDCMTVSETKFEPVSDSSNNNYQADNFGFDSNESNSMGNEEEYFEENNSDDSEEGYGDGSLSSNQMLVTLSYSLLSQVKQMARMEGVSPDDIILELIAEGVTKRAFQDFSRPKPSHLMTRTGYVPPEANGNSMAQPQMSHHMQQNSQFNGNNNNRGGNGNRRFGNNGNGMQNQNQNQNQNSAFFQNRGASNNRLGNNGNAMQGQNRGNGPQNNGNNAGNNAGKNMQRNKKSFNPNFQRNGNGPASGPRPHANGFNPNVNGNGNGSFSPDKDSDE